MRKKLSFIASRPKSSIHHLPFTTRHSSSSGFTLIELLLVIALVFIITTISALFYSNFYLHNAAGSVARQLASEFRKAQTYSMAGKQGSGWGVALAGENIILYDGSSYASRTAAFDETYHIPAALAVAGLSEINFAKVTGLPDATATVSIAGAGATYIVNVNGQGIVSNAAVAAGGGGSAGYAYYRAITVTSSTSIASGTQTNFPMLFSAVLSSFEPAADGGNARIQNLCTAPNGGQEPCDLIFSASSDCASPLNFETENYSSSTGALIDWVDIPSLSAGTTIYVCYDNPAVATDQSNPSLTWDGSYAGVWHFPNGTNLDANDATVNGNNGTVYGAAAGPGEADGGAVLNGSSQYIGTSYAQSSVTAYTIEGWVKVPSGNANANILVQDRGSGAGHSLTLGLDGQGACGGSHCLNTGTLLWGDDSNSIFIGVGSTALLNDGTWHYIAGTWTDPSGGPVAANQFKIYIDGAAVTSFNTLSIGSDASPLSGLSGTTFGYHQAWNKYYTGSMDEVRISTAVRSPSWVLTEYNNMADPAAFYAVGSEQ